MWGRINTRDHARAVLTAAIVGLAIPAQAAAANATDSTTSANWSGYAAHGDHAQFTRVTGTWRVPKLTCTPGERTYSAVWVGIGGFALNAAALEQTGTETDCRRNGSTRTTAWFEVVPSPSRTIPLNVKPGDVVAAEVTVNGRAVTVTLRDLTSRRHFSRELTVRHADTSSAEWIVEAPSNCSRGGTNCHTLPLANFGKVRFSHATVQTPAGQRGAIAGRRWRTTEILLHTRREAEFASAIPVAAAIPTALGTAAKAFSVVYRAIGAAIGPPGSGRARKPS